MACEQANVPKRGLKAGFQDRRAFARPPTASQAWRQPEREATAAGPSRADALHRFGRSHWTDTEELLVHRIAHRHRPWRMALVVALGCWLLAGGMASPALAADPTIQGVIDRLRLLLVGLLVGLATLALTVGGVRYLAAGGDPGEIQKAKTMFKAAAVGYAIAALAPALVGILRTVVGA